MPTFPNAASTGIAYKHYDELPRDFSAVTDSYEFEDSGRTFNRRTSNPPRVWNIEFKGHLTKTQTDQFDDFWETVGIDVPFDFVDKYGVTWANVRVKDYSRSHQAHKAWDKKVAFTLVSFSGVHSPDIPTLSGEAVGDGDSILWSWTD
jgi:hypothetical protein